MVGFCPLTIPYHSSPITQYVCKIWKNSVHKYSSYRSETVSTGGWNELQVKNQFSDQSRVDNSQSGKESDDPYPQYVTFDGQHICEVSFIYSI